MGLPWAFGSKGESDVPSSCRSQDRSTLTVCRQSGTERFLRPLPRIWTDMRNSKATSWTWRPASSDTRAPVLYRSIRRTRSR